MVQCASAMEDIETFIQKAQEGDREAYGSLYKSFYPRIFRYCRINLFNKFIAEDVCQEVFIKAWIALPKFTIKEGGTFQAFLFRIARNLIIDLSRKKKEVPIEEASDVPSNEDLIESLSQKENVEVVKKALSKLEEKERQIIILRYFEDLSHSEVAKIVGLKDGALRVRTIRLLKKLKEFIK